MKKKNEIIELLKNETFIISKILKKDNPNKYEEKIIMEKINYESGEIETEWESEVFSFLSKIYPGASLGTDKSAKNSLLTYKYTWFGKLIDSVITEEIKNKITKINYSMTDNEDYKNIQEEITKGFFGEEKKLIPLILAIKEIKISYIPSWRNIRTSFDIQIDDGRLEKVDYKSTGTQFITIIELFLNYIKKFKKNGILSIDEIESTLHPSVAKKIVSIISNEVNQFIFTTHSKELLKIVPFANIIKVSKKNKNTEIETIDKDKIKKIYPLIYNWPEIFFNDNLIISEGKEASVIEAIISKNPEYAKLTASINLDVINGNGTEVVSFIKNVKEINNKINCFFIYDSEYLLDEELKKICLCMLEFNLRIRYNDKSKSEILKDFENLKDFDEKSNFLKKYQIFIMNKKPSKELGKKNKKGFELYIKNTNYFDSQKDKKEIPLLIANKILNNESIDDIFDKEEYQKNIEEIIKYEKQ